jgi:hypothetical protein
MTSRRREVPFPDRDSSEVINLLGGAIVIAPQVDAEHGWLEPAYRAEQVWRAVKALAQ